MRLFVNVDAGATAERVADAIVAIKKSLDSFQSELYDSGKLDDKYQSGEVIDENDGNKLIGEWYLDYGGMR